VHYVFDFTKGKEEKTDE